MNQLKVTSVSLTENQITFAKGKGNASRFIRTLLDREMGNEQATERCQSLVRAYQNVLGRNVESRELMNNLGERSVEHGK